MMSWVEAANSEGPVAADKMPEGYHRAKVTKARRTKGGSIELRTDKGPYVLLVFENDAGEEATCKLWLTEKAHWRFAKALSRLGFDLKRMDEAGVSFEQFHDESFCQKQFEGRECWIKVEHREGGKYADAEPLHEREVPPDVLQRMKNGTYEPTVADDDIPF